MHNLFGVGLRPGAAGRLGLGRGRQVALERGMQARLFLFQGEDDLPGAGQVGFAQITQAGSLHVLDDVLQEPGGRNKYQALVASSTCTV